MSGIKSSLSKGINEAEVSCSNPHGALTGLTHSVGQLKEIRIQRECQADVFGAFHSRGGTYQVLYLTPLHFC